MRTRNPEQRLRAFLALCGSKRFDEETGAPQPAYKMDSMRIMAEFPKPKVQRPPPGSLGLEAAAGLRAVHQYITMRSLDMHIQAA